MAKKSGGYPSFGATKGKPGMGPQMAAKPGGGKPMSAEPGNNSKLKSTAKPAGGYRWPVRTSHGC